MNSNEAITLMQLANGATIVNATYENARDGVSKAYAFKNVIGADLEVDDLIVVETMDSYSIARVVDPAVQPDGIGCAYSALKHVVGKLDTASIDKIKASENKARYKLGMSDVHKRLSVYQDQLGSEYNSVRDMLGYTVKASGEDAEVIEDEPERWTENMDR
jgi:hypothetical protein